MRLDGRSLTTEALVAFARGGGPWDVQLHPAALRRVDAARAGLQAAAEGGAVYGITTGVGANRSMVVSPDERSAQAMRLLRSHVGGVGPVAPDDVARATMLVRINQLLVGRAGVDRRIVEALAGLLRSGHVPVVHPAGAIGTGDLGALAEIGLVLVGERPGAAQSVDFGPGDALAFMSSSALTIATASLAAVDLGALVDAATAIGALSFLALRGSSQAVDARVHDGQGRAGQARVAASVRRIAAGGATSERVQDPFGLRTMPQVHGVAVDCVDRTVGELERELNAGVENPMVVGSDVLHHGNFQLSALAAALDDLRGALVAMAALSVARVAAMMDSSLSGLPPFLGGGPSGSSGAMSLEYVAHDSLAELRARAVPVTLGAAPLWIAAEEHASFATQAARRATECVEPLTTALACELVAAMRALRMDPQRLGSGDGVALYRHAAAVLDADLVDRPLDGDVREAIGLLGRFADVARR